MADVLNFHFIRPYWLLALLPVGWLLVHFARQRRNSGLWQGYCDSNLLPYMLIGAQSAHKRWPIVLIALIAVLSIIALAGPAWQKIPQPVFRSQAALVLALDLSRSMDVADIKPSRLARAKHKVLDLLSNRKEGQTALIVYAQEAFVVTPLTQDTNTIAAMVKTLGTDLMPTQGSRPRAAVEKAVDLFKQAGVLRGDILLITDGVESGDVVEAVKNARQLGFKTSLLAVGTKEGAPIVDQRGGFVKDATGAIVIPKLDEERLRDIASHGGGRYSVLTVNDSDINYLTGRLRVPADDAQLQEDRDDLHVKTDRWREEGPWLLLVLLPLIALAFRRGVIAALILCMLPYAKDSQALEWSTLWSRADQQGAKAFAQGDHGKAAELFESGEWKAAALYKAEQFEKSVQFLESVQSADGWYNKGNALARMGQIEQAVAAYDKALEQSPQHADAKFNRDLLLEFLKNNQQQNQQNQQNSGDSQQQQDQQQSQGQQDSSQQNQDQQNHGQQNQDQHNQDQQDPSQAEQQHAQSQQSDQLDQQKGEQGEDNEEEQFSKTDTAQAEEQEQQHKSESSDEEQDSQQQQQLSQMSEEERSEQNEKMIAEQWLRRVPDDPGGLLRRKFRYQSQVSPRDARQEDRPW